jgi:4-amino-4-deoxy-L-arabinose transferase-like glycosyltransferase
MRRNTRILVCILFFVLLAIYFSIRDKWALHRIVDIAPDLEVLAVLLVIALVISMPPKWRYFGVISLATISIGSLASSAYLMLHGSVLIGCVTVAVGLMFAVELLREIDTMRHRIGQRPEG